MWTYNQGVKLAANTSACYLWMAMSWQGYGSKNIMALCSNWLIQLILCEGTTQTERSVREELNKMALKYNCDLDERTAESKLGLN